MNQDKIQDTRKERDYRTDTCKCKNRRRKGINQRNLQQNRKERET